MNSKVTAAVALTVTAIWAFSMVSDVMVADYNPPAGIHAALMAVLGAIFGIRLTTKDK